MRAETKSLRERAYVQRARSLGAGHTRVIALHILPQVAPILIALTVLQMAYAIFLETYVAFLGLGDPSLTSWGKLVQNAFESNAITADAWWAIVPPGVAVVIVVLACTLVGRAFEDALNPRLRTGHLSVRRFRVRRLPESGRRDSAGPARGGAARLVRARGGRGAPRGPGHELRARGGRAARPGR